MEQAIKLWGEKHPGSQDTFSTTWFPFYLQPDSPKQGIDKQQYFVQKFGADRMGMMFQRLDGIGRSVGIHFKFGKYTAISIHSSPLTCIRRKDWKYEKFASTHSARQNLRARETNSSN